MKLDLEKSELQAFIQEMQLSLYVQYATPYEAKLSGLVLKDIILKLMAKFMKDKEKYKVSFTSVELVVLNEVLPQIKSNKFDPYHFATLSNIYQKINKACLSI